jgi:hypothetical protein
MSPPTIPKATSKMNVQRNYNPRMFALLGVQPVPLSKAALGRLIFSYLNRTGAKISDGGTTYIQMNVDLQELSGLDDDCIYLFVNGISVVYPNGEDALQDFETKVYKKWVEA